MIVEICVSSYESLMLAHKYGADRVEICQNLSCGGLTPSLGLVQYSLDLGFNTQVLIRPRSGDFCYSSFEKEQILDELVLYQKLGIQGAVVGALDKDRKLDIPFLKQIRILTPKIELTFHKAFDDVLNWKVALENLITMKFNRILTAGYAINVDEGMKNLKDIISLSNGRIEILSGGGVREKNIRDIIDTIHPKGIHFSATKEKSHENSNFYSSKSLQVDDSTLQKMILLCRKQ